MLCGRTLRHGLLGAERHCRPESRSDHSQPGRFTMRQDCVGEWYIVRSTARWNAGNAGNRATYLNTGRVVLYGLAPGLSDACYGTSQAQFRSSLEYRKRGIGLDPYIQLHAAGTHPSPRGVSVFLDSIAPALCPEDNHCNWFHASIAPLLLLV